MYKKFVILVIQVKIQKRRSFLKLVKPILTSIYKKSQSFKFYTYTKMYYKTDTDQESIKENKAYIYINDNISRYQTKAIQ